MEHHPAMNIFSCLFFERKTWPIAVCHTSVDDCNHNFDHHWVMQLFALSGHKWHRSISLLIYVVYIWFTVSLLMLLFLSSTILEAFPPITFLKPNRFHTAFNIIYPTRKKHQPTLSHPSTLSTDLSTSLSMYQCSHLQIHPSILYLYSIGHCSTTVREDLQNPSRRSCVKISWMYIYIYMRPWEAKFIFEAIVRDLVHWRSLSV